MRLPDISRSAEPDRLPGSPGGNGQHVYAGRPLPDRQDRPKGRKNVKKHQEMMHREALQINQSSSQTSTCAYRLSNGTVKHKSLPYQFDPFFYTGQNWLIGCFWQTGLLTSLIEMPGQDFFYAVMSFSHSHGELNPVI